MIVPWASVTPEPIRLKIWQFWLRPPSASACKIWWPLQRGAGWREGEIVPLRAFSVYFLVLSTHAQQSPRSVDLLVIDVVWLWKEKNFVIFSDSLSSFQVIGGFNIDSDLVQELLKDYTVLEKMARILFFVGFLVMLESLETEKAQLQSQHSLCPSLQWNFLPPTCYHV